MAANHAKKNVPLASDSEQISTIRAGQGARVTTRKNAGAAADQARENAARRYLERHPEARPQQLGPERSGKNVAVLVLAAIAVLMIVFLLGSCVVGLLGGTSESDGDGQIVQSVTSDEPVYNDPESETATADGTLSCEGTTYSMTQGDDGLWGMVASGVGEKRVLFYIEGTPAALARRNNLLLVAENREDSWDIVCYTLGGSGASYLVDADGGKADGSGSVTGLSIDGTTVCVSTSAGETLNFSLV